RGRRGRPFLRPVDGVGPALHDRGVVLEILVGRHERCVVGKAHGGTDRGEEIGFAVEFELRGVRLDENGVLALAESHAPTRAGTAILFKSLASLSGSTPFSRMASS